MQSLTGLTASCKNITVHKNVTKYKTNAVKAKVTIRIHH